MSAQIDHFVKLPLQKRSESFYRIGSGLDGVIIDGILHIRQPDVVGNIPCTSSSFLDKEIVHFGEPISWLSDRFRARAITVEDFEYMYKTGTVCNECLAQLEIVETFEEYLWE